MTVLAYIALALLTAQILTLAATRPLAPRGVWRESAAHWLLLTGGPVLLPALAVCEALVDRGWFITPRVNREVYDHRTGHVRTVGPRRLAGCWQSGVYWSPTRRARFVMLGRGRVGLTIGRTRAVDPATLAA